MASRIVVRLKWKEGFKLEDCKFHPTKTAGAAGVGRHEWDVSAASAIRIFRYFNVLTVLYAPVIFLAKLSVLLQYLQIFTPSKSGILYWSIHSLIWSNLLFYTICVLVGMFNCRPLRKIWDFTVPGHCLDGVAIIIVTGAWNVFSDLLILAFPLYAIWHLHMPMKKKLSVGAMFATGLFACVASIVRLHYCIRVGQDVDDTYIYGPVVAWSVAEIATVILCGSGIFLPKFIALVRRRPCTSQQSQQAPAKEARLPRTVSFGPLINGHTSDPRLLDASTDGIDLQPREDLEAASRQNTMDDYHEHVRQLLRRGRDEELDLHSHR
ncbi:MAG: hypothetical protein Q9222_000944 [Ikaeria aurantiellina]